MYDAPVAPARETAELVRRLVLLLGKTLTASGHVMQRVEFERRGYCSVRRESPICTETLAALHDAIDWLESAGVVEPNATPAPTVLLDTAPARMAYADPPYLGCCGLYGHHHPDGRCWDDLSTHRHLIDRLTRESPHGWALSCSSTALRALLPLCPDDVRIGAWVKPFHAFKRGVRPAYAWEPVIYRGGRNRGHKPPPKGGQATTPRDWVAANITLQKGLTGAKPPEFCRWVFDILGLRPGDELVDLFPGTGIVTETWLGKRVAVEAHQPGLFEVC